MYYLYFIAIIFCMFMCVRTLFSTNKLKYNYVSIENFLVLSMTYTILMMGFGLIYLLLNMHGLAEILDHGEPIERNHLQRIGAVMYLSAVTLFSVGSGDVLPLGFARFVAIIEALLGYTIPTAFVVKSVLNKK